MPATDLQLVARGLNRCSIRITFVHCTDRYAHHIAIVSDEGLVIPLMESVEGDAGEAWPDSPPLQQISIEPIDGHPTGLLTGMAGKGHWSASIAPDPNKPAFDFDIAARAADAADSLRSSYRLHEDWQPRQESTPTELIMRRHQRDDSVDADRIQVCLKTPIDRGSAFELSGARPSLVCIGPTRSEAEQVTTIRWTYRVELGLM